MKLRVLTGMVVAMGLFALPAVAQADPALTVSGNEIIDTNADVPIQLHGVNRASFEYTCVSPTYGGNPNATHGGPIDNQSIDAMESWNINVVRIPLNEQCWLGVNPLKRKANKVVRLHGSAARKASKRIRTRYRNDVEGYVNRLNAHGIAAILDLHWSAPGKFLARSQHRAPDTSHSIDFWRGVSHRFAGNDGVIFDLFNEPLHVSQKCLMRGGCKVKSNCADCSKAGQKAPKYKVASFKKLIAVIRGQGSLAPIMLSGPGYTHDLRKWKKFVPRDPAVDMVGRPLLIASFHNYISDQNRINNEGFLCHRKCWNQVIDPLSDDVPVVTGEFGQFDCKHDYVSDYMDWADQRGISYLGWWWFVKGKFDGKGCQLALIKNYKTGAPTNYGKTFRNHFLGVRGF